MPTFISVMQYSNAIIFSNLYTDSVKCNNKIFSKYFVPYLQKVYPKIIGNIINILAEALKINTFSTELLLERLLVFYDIKDLRVRQNYERITKLYRIPLMSSS